MTKLNIVIAGHVCIDNNVIDGVKRRGWGSTAMYISQYLKSADNIHTSILAPYGQDFLRYKGSSNFINKSGDKKTMIYENIIIHGRRSQYCRNYEHIQTPKITTAIKERLRHADIVIIAPMISEYPKTYVSHILRETSSSCLKVLLPQGYMRTIESNGKVRNRDFLEAQELLEKFDLAILSDEDLENSTIRALEWSNDHADLTVIVTKAEKGADVFKNGEKTSVSTASIPFEEIVNPVGAGDIFSANLSVALRQNPENLISSVKQANKETGLYLKRTN